MQELLSTRQSEFAAFIERHTGSDGSFSTAIPQLALIRSSKPTVPIHTLYNPSLCIIVQGRKVVMVGEQVYYYGPEQCLVVSVDLPMIGQVIEASPEHPYLCFVLEIDPAKLGELILETGGGAPLKPQLTLGLAISPVETSLLDAAIRLMRLLDTPSDIPILAPMIMREVFYRLLSSEQSAHLRQIAFNDNRLHAVSRAISWLKHNYSEPFHIETLAREARMSPSALHHHFKTITAMSPLQYQKQLRLQEARRLMLGQAMDAATAAHSVGYESSSQFSREYSRLFGEPPARDIARLKDVRAYFAV